MAQKCLSEEEQKKIIETKRTEGYSNEQLAEMFHVSKGTIHNVIHGYPYTTSPEEFRERVFRDMRCAMDAGISKLREQSQKALDEGDNVMHVVLHQMRDHISRFAPLGPEEMGEALKKDRLSVEQSAFIAQARGNGIHFAYYSNLWQVLTDILGDLARNPFTDSDARSRAKKAASNVKYSGVKNFLPMGRNCKENNKRRLSKKFDSISDELWKELKSAIDLPPAWTGRPHAERRNCLYGILYCIEEGISFREAERRGYGAYRTLGTYYALWWGTGVFRLLWQIAYKWPELERIRVALANMEAYRAAFPDKIPSIKEIAAK